MGLLLCHKKVSDSPERRALKRNEMDRYKAQKIGENTWRVFDTERNCAVLTSISPNAKYNRETVEFFVKSANKTREWNLTK